MSHEPDGHDCLYNVVVRRLRAARTMFGQNVKLVLRQISEEQWSLLTLPYLLVVPTVTRVRPLRPADNAVDSIINPHSMTFVAQFDAHGSEAEWRAACDVEIAERQLISTLVNWRPNFMYKPTAYGGMRIEGSRSPAVRVSFVYTFFEELFLSDDNDEWQAQVAGQPVTDAQLQIILARRRECQASVPDPCAEYSPCWPDPVWTANNGGNHADHHDSESD